MNELLGKKKKTHRRKQLTRSPRIREETPEKVPIGLGQKE
jgi:hypothetical protein